MTRRADLHTHSYYSDGTASPADVARSARRAGVEVLVLSDHDSVSGYDEAREEGERIGVRVLCGVEINTNEGEQLHILGYGLDARSPRLQAGLAEFRARREARAGRILVRLREAGVDVSWEDVRGVSRQALGRPHIADAMVRRRIVRTRREAFARYLTPGKAGYVAPMGPTPEEALALIREAGGWAVLAHPGLLDFEACVERLAPLGLAGIETYYPTHNGPLVRRLLELAGRRGLVPTAGSDYHGPGSGRERIGGIELAPDLFERLVERL